MRVWNRLGVLRLIFNTMSIIVQQRMVTTYEATSPIRLNSDNFRLNPLHHLP